MHGLDGLINELLNRNDQIRHAVSDSQIRKIWKTTGKLIAQELLAGKVTSAVRIRTRQALRAF